jgi:hypothetical protein
MLASYPQLATSVEKVASSVKSQNCQNDSDILNQIKPVLQIHLELTTLVWLQPIRGPASGSEKRTHDAEKIGSIQYSEFFNGIGPKVNCRDVRITPLLGREQTCHGRRAKSHFNPELILSVTAFGCSARHTQNPSRCCM